MMLEEVRIRSLWEQHKDDLGIQFPGEKLHPIQMAAHLGASWCPPKVGNVRGTLLVMNC